jgi:hypothetical protein
LACGSSCRRSLVSDSDCHREAQRMPRRATFHAVGALKRSGLSYCRKNLWPAARRQFNSGRPNEKGIWRPARKASRYPNTQPPPALRHFCLQPYELPVAEKACSGPGYFGILGQGKPSPRICIPTAVKKQIKGFWWNRNSTFQLPRRHPLQYRQACSAGCAQYCATAQRQPCGPIDTASW